MDELKDKIEKARTDFPPTVAQADARILREALAHCGNYGSPMIKDRAKNALYEYALRVRPYCQHPDKSRLRGFKVCIDCGYKEVDK